MCRYEAQEHTESHNCCEQLKRKEENDQMLCQICAGVIRTTSYPVDGQIPSVKQIVSNDRPKHCN